MSQVSMVVVDAKQTKHRKVGSWVADLVIASLSAEPETILEMRGALRRFLRSTTPATRIEEWDEGEFDAGSRSELCYIDLAARLIVSVGEQYRPEHRGSVTFVDEQPKNGRVVQYRLPADWMISDRQDALQTEAPKRRQQRLRGLGRNSREVLYRDVCEFIAKQCIAHRDSDEFDDPVAEIHKRWLTQPRAPLDGECPRSILLENVDFIDGDLSDRAGQWARLGSCPDSLAEESYAFQFGGFGTHEIVLYYDLVRNLICESWDRTSDEPWGGNGQLATGLRMTSGAAATSDRSAALLFERCLETEISRLEQSKKEWLETPQKDLHGKSPAEVIHAERSRVPVTISPDEMILDCECPLCQWLADNDHGPTFLHLDSSHMDWDFEFSFCKNREEWTSSIARLSSDRTDSTLGLLDNVDIDGSSDFAYPEESYSSGSEWLKHNTVWKLSGSDPAIFHANLNRGELAIVSFAVGAHVSELKLDLKANAEDAVLADELGVQFESLIEALKTDNRMSKNSAISRFCSVLTTISDARGDLAEKCADLESRLVRLMD